MSKPPTGGDGVGGLQIRHAIFRLPCFAQYDNAVSQYGKDSFEVSRAYKQLESAAINLDERNIDKQAFDGLYQKYEVEEKKDELAEDVAMAFDESAHTMKITMGKQTEN